MIKNILFTLLILMNMAAFAQDGKLHTAKEKLKEKPVQTQTAGTTHTNRRAGYKEEKPFRHLVTAIAVNLTYGVLVESIFERNTEMHYAEIARYPYQSKKVGDFVYIQSDSTKYALSRFDISNHFLYENTHLYGNDFTALFRFAKRFDIAVEYLQFIEKTSSGTEGIAVFSGLVNYHRVRTQKLDVWFGLGTAYVANDVHKWGLAYHVGAAYFIQKPISLEAIFKGSSIQQESLNQYRVSLNYHIKKLALSGGYAHFDLAGSRINTLVLGMKTFL